MNRKATGMLSILAALAMLFVLGCAQAGPTVTVENSFDVVVIGAGGGGMSAAVEAADAGASVVVLEKMPGVGGNTMYATGGMNAPGTRYQEALGIEDSVDLFVSDAMTGGRELNDPALVNVMATNAAEAVHWLADLGADLSDVGRMGGHSVNRTHRPTGGAAVGAEIVLTLEQAVLDRGVDIREGNMVTEILMNRNGAYGVRVERMNGEVYEIRAGAVIVATGGFGADNSIVAEIDPDLLGFGTTNHRGATGDAIQMLGDSVAWVDLEQIQTHPTVVPERNIMITEAVRGNGAIMVGREGTRFVNELGTRDVVSESILAQPGGTAFLLFDQEVRESLSAIETYARQRLMVEGETLEALAIELGMPTDALEQAVAEYNDAVAAGEDAAYGRPQLPRTLTTGPFYAIEIGPAVHHTMGGVGINTSAQVISANNAVIPGLYAAGEVTGGVHGANRLGGNALADIVVFGRIAGQNAAAYARR